MRLSEAIRLGATMKPQGFYHLYNAVDDTLCAMGAALAAVGILDKWTCDDIGINERRVMATDLGWIELMEREDIECPECGYLPGQLPVPHLNDHHRWSRERIADWLKMYEPLPEAPDQDDIMLLWAANSECFIHD